jgi:hypothetical protein
LARTSSSGELSSQHFAPLVAAALLLAVVAGTMTCPAAMITAMTRGRND